MFQVIKEAWKAYKNFNKQMKIMEKIMTRTFSPAIESLENSIERNSDDIGSCERWLLNWEDRRDSEIAKLNKEISQTKRKFTNDAKSWEDNIKRLNEANKILQDTIDKLGDE